RSTGIILGITPRVSDNNRVILDLEQEVSNATGAANTATSTSPTIQERRVKTTVTVNSGETILLAGLIKDQSEHDNDKVPVLGDLSIIGNAFKSKADSINRTELLIAIT